MVTRNITFAQGEFYHIYNRGTEKRTIFLDAADHRRFMELLFLSNSSRPVNVRDIQKAESSVFDFDRGEPLVDIGAYCLMPNHFHILAAPRTDNGLSVFMNKLGTSYSMYFNKRYDRTGSLFQGRYKGKWAHSDEYLKYLFSYIHLNPVKLIQSDWKEKGISDTQAALAHLTGYQYSSFPDYDAILESSLGAASVKQNERKEKNILSIDAFPQYFHTHFAFRKEILEWITFDQS